AQLASPPYLRNSTMRKLVSMLGIALLFSGLALSVKAVDDQEKTIEGEGQCAKCSLRETPKCVNAIVVDEDGKKVTYYMDMTNPVAKKFHGKICMDILQVKATGTVKEEDGKKILTPKTIEVVEE